MPQTRVLVTGAGGFIGGHLVRRLKSEGFWVRSVDIKEHEFSASAADEFILGDLRDQAVARDVTDGVTQVYQLAADMGEPATSSPANTTPRGCTTRPRST